jgi:hypothetical protein
MAETAIGFACHAGEVGFLDGIADERPNYLDGDFRIRPAGEAGEDLMREPRPAVRHIEAAVASKTREHDFGEAEA